jgi:hypothetical protein
MMQKYITKTNILFRVPLEDIRGLVCSLWADMPVTEVMYVTPTCMQRLIISRVYNTDKASFTNVMAKHYTIPQLSKYINKYSTLHVI